MILLKVTRLRKHALILSLLVLLACVLAGTRANAQGDDLITAAYKGDLPRVNVLLAKGADINTKDSDGWTALMKASQNGHFEVVQALLAKGADVNSMTDRGSTALMVASVNGYSEVVQTLLVKGADANAKTSNGETVLISTIEYISHFNTVHDDETMLFSTLIPTNQHRSHLNVVRALLAKGADVNAKDSNGETALDAASIHGYLEIVRALLAKGADVNAKENSYPDMPIWTYLAGHTALISASFTGHIDVVRVLLANGADINARTNNGLTALDAATLNRHDDVRVLLVRAGAKSSF